MNIKLGYISNKENVYHMVHNNATNAVTSLLENPSMWYEPSLDFRRDFNSSTINNYWLHKFEGLENLIQSDKVCSEILNPKELRIKAMLWPTGVFAFCMAWSKHVFTMWLQLWAMPCKKRTILWCCW